MITSLSFSHDPEAPLGAWAPWERGGAWKARPASQPVRCAGGEAAGAAYGPKSERLTGQGDAGEPVDLDRYRKTGHLVLEGKLGDEPVIVVMTPYAQGRMTLRDVEATEVLEVLAKPRSTHGTGRTSGRYEVAGATDRGRIRVVYERPARDVVLVITVYPESE